MRRLLQSPIFVGVMAVAALLLMAKNFGLLGGGENGGGGSSQKAPAKSNKSGTADKKSKAAPDAGGSDVVPENLTIEVTKVGWVQTPERDPFQPPEGTLIADDEEVAAPSAREALTLKGTWHQAEGGWAVVNNRVVDSDTSIGEFKIEEIQPDGIWVSGPRGREWVGFLIPAANPAPMAQQRQQENVSNNPAKSTQTKGQN